MATTNYGLPTITDNMTADVVRDHNDLAVAVDEKLKEVDDKVGNIDFSSLQTQIDKKADKVHKHVISDVTDLQTTLHGKANTSHKHAISDVTDLQTTLNSKANQEEVTAHLGDLAHVYWVGNVTGTNVLSATSDDISDYKDGLGVSFANTTDSNSATSLNINGLGAIPIKKANGNNVTNLKANGVYTLRYSSVQSAFILQGEGGEYGNVTTQDVKVGKIFGTENGLQTGEYVAYSSGDTISIANLSDEANFYSKSYTVPLSIIPKTALYVEWYSNDKNHFTVSYRTSATASSSSTYIKKVNVTNMEVVDSNYHATSLVEECFSADGIYYGYRNITTHVFYYHNFNTGIKWSHTLPNGQSMQEVVVDDFGNLWISYYSGTSYMVKKLNADTGLQEYNTAMKVSTLKGYTRLFSLGKDIILASPEYAELIDATTNTVKSNVTLNADVGTGSDVSKAVRISSGMVYAYSSGGTSPYQTFRDYIYYVAENNSFQSIGAWSMTENGGLYQGSRGAVHGSSTKMFASAMLASVSNGKYNYAYTWFYNPRTRKITNMMSINSSPISITQDGYISYPMFTSNHSELAYAVSGDYKILKPDLKSLKGSFSHTINGTIALNMANGTLVANIGGSGVNNEFLVQIYEVDPSYTIL